MPFTSGFVAKFSVIAAAVEARSYWLAVVAMVSAVVAAYAYLRLVVTMYFRDPADASPDTQPSPIGAGAALVITLAVLATLALGIAPGLLESLTTTATGL